MASRNPTSWEDYEHGLSPSRSMASIVSSGMEGEEGSLLDDGGFNDAISSSPAARRRRSSVSNRLAVLTDLGGVNSIRSFTRSWQRAAGFAEVLPQRPSFVFAQDQAPLLEEQSLGPPQPPPPESIQYSRSHIEPTPGLRTSLLRQHLEATGRHEPGSSSDAIEVGPGISRPGTDGPSDAYKVFREREQKADDGEPDGRFLVPSPFGGESSNRHSIFAIPPHLATPPLFGSYSSYRSYGSIPSQSDLESRPTMATPWTQPVDASAAEEELPPILVREVEQDGKIVLAVEGQSTLPQTVFNSINVLIGVGLLSLPLGLKYAGWVCGMAILLFCAIVTSYTARLLAKCMDLDPSLITFSDVAYISFGSRARFASSVLFTLELMAANVALVVLFADSLDLLFPGLMSLVQWKMTCTAILIPLSFMPLRLLSFTSVIGIFSCICIVGIVVIDGFIKPHSPGSLLEPAAAYLFPARWSTLPLSFGLFLSPWGGHSVFPNIYRDMRHPYRYGQALKTTYIFTYLLDTTTAVAGILMFGDGVRDEITSNILKTSGYPRALTALMCVFIAIIPLTKIPLNARPIVNMVERLIEINPPLQQARADLIRRRPGPVYRAVVSVLVRVCTVASFLIVAILFPNFDTIMAFMGSGLCFSICIIMPLAFYLKLFQDQISPRERLLAYFLIVVSSVCSVVGTVWAFLPKSLIGAN